MTKEQVLLRILNGLAAIGYLPVALADEEEEVRADRAYVLEHAFDTDFIRVTFENQSGSRRWVQLNWCDEPFEAVEDYSLVVFSDAEWNRKMAAIVDSL